MTRDSISKMLAPTRLFFLKDTQTHIFKIELWKKTIATNPKQHKKEKPTTVRRGARTGALGARAAAEES